MRAFPIESLFCMSFKLWVLIHKKIDVDSSYKPCNKSFITYQPQLVILVGVLQLERVASNGSAHAVNEPVKKLVSLSLSMTSCSSTPHTITAHTSANHHQPLRRVSSNQVPANKDSTNTDSDSRESSSSDKDSTSIVNPGSQESANHEQDNTNSTNMQRNNKELSSARESSAHSLVTRMRSSSEEREPVVYRKQTPAIMRSISDSPKGLSYIHYNILSLSIYIITYKTNVKFFIMPWLGATMARIPSVYKIQNER